MLDGHAFSVVLLVGMRNYIFECTEGVHLIHHQSQHICFLASPPEATFTLQARPHIVHFRLFSQIYVTLRDIYLTST